MSMVLPCDRDFLERAEVHRLHPLALRSTDATYRLSGSERARDLRLEFQRDRDRILHCRAFRRLKHKTQVFVPHLADHQRTRLTHTLEVAQLGRTIARALALNEDLVEAIAYGHDLGHTAFGHMGEAILDEILHGTCSEIPLPPAVIEQVGSFKHNFQSLRVVDLLEHRYSHPGLNLSDQVREGILKHTSTPADFHFPLPEVKGLRLHRPCHLEGQVVAVADEIAQQTHDLEDGLRAGAVALSKVEKLKVSRVVVDRLDLGTQPPPWHRQSLLIRGMISLFVTDVITTTATAMAQLTNELEISSHEEFLRHRDQLPPALAWFSPAVDELFNDLRAFIYQFIINHPQVNRQDWRARKVVTGLYRAFWLNPLNLPSYALLRARDELGFTYLRDIPLAEVADEVSSRYHTSPGFARLVADHIAGMSDRFALEEYHSLEHPSPDQHFYGELR